MRLFTCLLLLSLTAIHATTWENRGDLTCDGGYKKRLNDGTVECETSCSRDIFRETYKDAAGTRCCTQKDNALCVEIKSEFESECGSCGSCMETFRSNGMNYAKLDLSSWNLDENSPLVQNLNDPDHAFVGTTTYINFDSDVEITKAQTFKNYRLEVDCTDPELEDFCASCERGLCENTGAKVMMTTFSDPDQTYCYHTGALCASVADCGEGDSCTNDFQQLISVVYTNDDGTPVSPFVIDGAELGEALTQQNIRDALEPDGAETAVNNAKTDGYTDLFACWSGETGECSESGNRRRRLLQRGNGECRL